jgi:hypothetical protein
MSPAPASDARSRPAAASRSLPRRDCLHALSWLTGGFVSPLVYAAARSRLSEAQLLSDAGLSAELVAARLSAAWAEEQARPRPLCCCCSRRCCARGGGGGAAAPPAA